MKPRHRHFLCQHLRNRVRCCQELRTKYALKYLVGFKRFLGWDWSELLTKDELWLHLIDDSLNIGLSMLMKRFNVSIKINKDDRDGN